MLDLRDRLVVIVGGGAVGSRKAKGVLDAGAAAVRVVSPQFHAEMPARVERIGEKYETRHLDGAGLVFAATDDATVNAAVARDARMRGILVNRADSDDGDFLTPAVLREGAVTIAVNAGGSPAIAARIRDEIAKTLQPRWIALAEAMTELRPMVLAADLPGETRRDLFRELATEEAAEIAVSGGVPALQKRIELRIGKRLRGANI